MPHIRRSLFGLSTPAIEQRERVAARTERERREAAAETAAEEEEPQASGILPAIGRFFSNPVSKDDFGIPDVTNLIDKIPDTVINTLDTEQRVTENITNIFYKPASEQLVEKDETDQEGADSTAAQTHAKASQIEAKVKEGEQFIADLDLDKFSDPVAREAAQVLIEEKEIELAQLEIELLNLMNALGVQDLIFDLAAEDAGLADALDIAPLEKALAQDGGLGASTYQAILDLAKNVDLSEQERNEGIDIVLARQHFSEEIVKTINDLVQNKTNLEEFIARPDYEIITDVADFLNPSFNFNVTGENDSQRFFNDLKNTFDILIEVPVRIPDGDESFTIYNELILTVMQFGVDFTGQTASGSSIDFLIDSLSQSWEIDKETLRSAFKEIRVVAEDNRLQWDAALDAGSLVPGSKSAVAAIYQAGEGIGFDPQQLEMASMSKALHALIDTQSQGISGRKGGGTIAGIGGLTLQTYIDVMNGEEWTPERGMEWELQALLEYIRQIFGGDALRAVNFWRDTGEWGGTEGFPGAFSDRVDPSQSASSTATPLPLNPLRDRSLDGTDHEGETVREHDVHFYDEFLPEQEGA